MYLPKQSSKYLGKFKVYRNLKIKNFPMNNNDDSLSNSNEQIGNFEQTEQTNNNNTNKRNYRKRLNMDSVIPIKRVKFQTNLPMQMNMIKKKKHKLHNTVSSHKKKFEFNPKKVKKTAVACYNDNGDFIKSFTSITEAAIENKVSPSTLHGCISGKCKHCANLR